MIVAVIVAEATVRTALPSSDPMVTVKPAGAETVAGSTAPSVPTVKVTVPTPGTWTEWTPAASAVSASISISPSSTSTVSTASPAAETTRHLFGSSPAATV